MTATMTSQAAVVAAAAANLQKDTTYTKIFVGGLPYHTTDTSLREFFEQFGEIDEAVVITDRQTNKSRGYGFVTMSDRSGAERACKEPNPVIDGRKANVNLAYLGAKPRGIQPDIFSTAAAASALPLAALKAGIPGFVPNQYGLPQYYYPSSYLTTPGITLTSGMSPHASLSPTTAAAAAASAGFFDYASVAAAAAAAAGALPAGAATSGGPPGVAQLAQSNVAFNDAYSSAAAYSAALASAGFVASPQGGAGFSYAPAGQGPNTVGQQTALGHFANPANAAVVAQQIQAQQMQAADRLQ